MTLFVFKLNGPYCKGAAGVVADDPFAAGRMLNEHLEQNDATGRVHFPHAEDPTPDVFWGWTKTFELLGHQNEKGVSFCEWREA